MRWRRRRPARNKRAYTYIWILIVVEGPLERGLDGAPLVPRRGVEQAVGLPALGARWVALAPGGGLEGTTDRCAVVVDLHEIEMDTDYTAQASTAAPETTLASESRRQIWSAWGKDGHVRA